MGTGRAANATGARASAHRTRLQLALVGRADERAARHHLRRILPLIEISAKRNDWAQKGSRSYSPPPSKPPRRAPSRVAGGIARIERSGVFCLHVWCRRRSSGPPGTQAGHAPAQNARGGAPRGAS